MISRRRFLLAGAGVSLGVGFSGCSRFGLQEIPTTISYPGMAQGHALRDHQTLPPPSGEVRTDVVILGAGIAGLTAGWRLRKSGFKDFILLAGPELYGNAAGGAYTAAPDIPETLPYPKGAHYLPLPSMESDHVREILMDAGVIEKNPFSAKPTFDERIIVHSPDERLFFNGKWQEGLLPEQGVSAEEQAQQAKFFQYVNRLKFQHGSDGLRVFCIPIVLSSSDPEWRALDQMTFKQWLAREGYTAPSLLTYLNYCCRDDFGANCDVISAWAGLHYFSARAGKASNASEGAVLTWADGLNPLARFLAQSSKKELADGMAVRVIEKAGGVEVLAARQDAGHWKTWTIKARRAICAMPVHVAAHVVENIHTYGFDPDAHMPPYAAWMVSNFLMGAFPAEAPGAPLAWDNVIHGGHGLGYVVSTHQQIRRAPPPQTVFSAYQVFSDSSPQAARDWLTHASADALYTEAACDLNKVYGAYFREHAKAVEITVRGHAMASPVCGFLSNHGLSQLRTVQGKLLFAHSDLSGFSIFEEASWWGNRAALLILGEG